MNVSEATAGEAELYPISQEGSSKRDISLERDSQQHIGHTCPAAHLCDRQAVLNFDLNSDSTTDAYYSAGLQLSGSKFRTTFLKMHFLDSMKVEGLLNWLK